MIFRDVNGKLIEINRLDFINDKLYYNKIIQIKHPISLYTNKDAKINSYNINNLINLNLNKID